MWLVGLFLFHHLSYVGGMMRLNKGELIKMLEEYDDDAEVSLVLSDKDEVYYGKLLTTDASCKVFKDDGVVITKNIELIGEIK